MKSKMNSNKENFDVIIVGSGIGGLVTASQLAAKGCLLYTSPSPRDRTRSRMPSSA